MEDTNREPPLPEASGPAPRFQSPLVNESLKIDQQALTRRIAEEKAYHERGFPVAGHDFRREREDRERER